MSDLLSCPFCGATPQHNLGKKRSCQMHGDELQDHTIKCPHGCAQQTAPTKELAVERWNQRAVPSESLEELLGFEIAKALIPRMVKSVFADFAFSTAEAKFDWKRISEELAAKQDDARTQALKEATQACSDLEWEEAGEPVKWRDIRYAFSRRIAELNARSACVGVCKLDQHQVCEGCGRTIAQITKAGLAQTKGDAS